LTGIRVLLIGAAIAVLGPLCLRAAPRLDSHLNFRRLTPEQGLPAAVVHAIYQDRRGFIWFGTGDGLVRYDGSELRLFRHDGGNPHSLPGDVVFDIDEDANADLWVGTDAGLSRWERATERFTTYEPTAPAGRESARGVVDVLVRRAGDVWVATEGGSLQRFDPRTGTFTLLNGPARTGTSLVRCLTQDRQGSVWAGTASGEVLRLDANGVAGRRFDVAGPFGAQAAGGHVTTLVEGTDGSLWAGTDHGLARVDVERGPIEFHAADPGNPRALQVPLVEALVVDREGGLFVGTDGGGLSRFDETTGGFEHFRHDSLAPFSLTSDTVVSLLADRAGDLWVGTGPAGVSHANRLVSAFRTQRRQSGSRGMLSDEVILAFAEDASGDLWVGTDAGLNRLDVGTGAWTTYRHDPRDPRSLAADAITSLQVDARGRLWVGTYRGGLNLFDARRGAFTRYLPDSTRADALSDSRVWRIAEDAAHRLWIGTQAGGVSVLDPDTGRFTHHRHDPDDPRSLPDDNVLCVLVSRSGTVWAGTRQGLARWNAGEAKWDRLASEGSGPGALSDGFVVDLFEASDGALWIATQGGGLNRHDPVTGRIDVFGPRDGLPSGHVRGILESPDGVLWVSTNQGLARLDPRTRRVRVYDAADGVQGLLFNRGARLRLRSGDLLFGGSQGYTAFDPLAIGENVEPPPVVITQLETFPGPGEGSLPPSPGGSISETRTLTVPTSLSVLTFQFAALNYRAPHKNRISYRLEGFDDDWRAAGAERRATYTNLDPGRYRLRVRAANNDGTWNEEGVALDLVVVPPFWRKPWFRFLSMTLALVALSTAAWWVSSSRMRRRLEVSERERALAVERQRAEETLRLRERNYLEIFNSTEDAIILRDADTGVMLDANEAAVRMFGYPKADLLSKSIADLAEGGQDFDQRAGLERVREAFVRGAAKFEWRSRRAGGEPFWSEVQLTRSAIGGENRVLAVIRDISERRRLEEERLRLERQLQHAQKLESLGVLAGGIAHDFNNLLVGILGNLDLALRDLPPGLPAWQTVSDAEHAARRAADLSRQMLAYSGRGRFLVERVALHALVREMVPLLATSISKKASLNLALDETAPPLSGDVTQIRQVVMNLVINASEAIGDGGGTITVSTGAGDFTANRLGQLSYCDEPLTGRYVWLDVKDTGAGMDAATTERIFEPFFTTKFTGRGLGLSAVLGIVRGHRGALDVRSRIGAGTTFRVLFPAADGAAEPLTARTAAAGDTGLFTGTALLVDDEEGVRSVGSRMLSRLGFDVVTASNGHDAVDIYRARKDEVSVVLLDLTMPGLGGEDTLRELLAIDPGARVLVSSGFAQQDVASRFQGLAIAGFVAKPYSLTDLAERIAVALKPAHEGASRPRSPEA
jgi:PAS domain S-box-containing protein